VVGSDFMTLEAKRFRISGSFLGLVLAMALLGPAPAVAMGIACSVTDALRSRTRGILLLNNLATYATFPLLGALVLAWIQDSGATPGGGYAVAVFGVFIAANALNFAMIAGHNVLLRGGSLTNLFRTVYLPVLPWELATASLTAMAVYGFAVYGAGVVGLFALALGVCQLLLRALLEGQAHGEEVERRTDQLDVRHEGMLGLLLETLSLRDPNAAHHAAAVAHYAHELARAAGLSAREQAVVHTAGLLHDIGKFSFPDAILLAEQPLSDEDWRIVRRHPEEGARVVARMEAYGPVADIILGHHERWDGQGYPRGLIAETIPLLSRVIMIADAYDVMIARDSYRRPRTSAEAVAELRRAAGTQFDPELVETFVELLGNRGLRFQHADDADFEAELAFERRVRRYARGRVFA
jgi:putative nucleotidyltransferase with HDIG domain